MTIEKSTIPFQGGHAKLDVFQDTTSLVVYGLNAQWNYDNNCQDLHIWNTAFGFEQNAEEEYTGNKHRQALSTWLMREHNVAPDTLVLVQSVGFSGGYDLR
jgi:hypothetical protein